MANNIFLMYLPPSDQRGGDAPTLFARFLLARNVGVVRRCNDCQKTQVILLTANRHQGHRKVSGLGRATSCSPHIYTLADASSRPPCCLLTRNTASDTPPRTGVILEATRVAGS